MKESYQRNDIKRTLLSKGKITMLEAFSDLGISQLATRISEIEDEDNIEFDRIRKRGTNRYGRGFSYVEYTLKEEDKERVRELWNTKQSS